ncbi:MAG: formylglycine-generating enzyme family protein [Nitrosomonas sp.]|nr:formylglycine-generating enzyme family protein [Nitrosomonas sp.]
MFKIREHKILPDKFPESWASDWGEDEFGLWMAFTYKGVKQAFRWCEPGTFLMGSPEDEPERLDNELQHEVTLTKGFWIADTPVTQALWQVVMGENPGRFQGEERPVENVSWDDAQVFITKMNDLKPELKLCLPSEAQWEYACRAGTATSFSWGDQIDSSLVNFDGNYPYNDGHKSEYREQTVDVKELPCNDWGLYQMHGNVWEWCQDLFVSHKLITVIDPLILYHPEDFSFYENLVRGEHIKNIKVLRGGSWVSLARFCRSAHRNCGELASDDIGFRLARGH